MKLPGACVLLVCVWVGVGVLASDLPSASAPLSMWDFECSRLPKESALYTSLCSAEVKTFSNPLPVIRAACGAGRKPSKGVAPEACTKCQTTMMYMLELIFDGATDTESIDAVWTMLRQDATTRVNFWLNKNEIVPHPTPAKRPAQVAEATDKFCTATQQKHMTGFWTSRGLFTATSGNYKLCKNLVQYIINPELPPLDVFLTDADGNPIDPPTTATTTPFDVLTSLGWFYTRAFADKAVGSQFSAAMSTDGQFKASISPLATPTPGTELFERLPASLKAFARDVCACGSCGCEGVTQCGLMELNVNRAANPQGDDALNRRADVGSDGSDVSGDGSDVSGDVTEMDVSGKGVDSLSAIVSEMKGPAAVAPGLDASGGDGDGGLKMAAKPFLGLRAFLDQFLTLHDVVNVMNFDSGLGHKDAVRFEGKKVMGAEERAVAAAEVEEKRKIMAAEDAARAEAESQKKNQAFNMMQAALKQKEAMAARRAARLAAEQSADLPAPAAVDEDAAAAAAVAADPVFAPLANPADITETNGLGDDLHGEDIDDEELMASGPNAEAFTGPDAAPAGPDAAAFSADAGSVDADAGSVDADAGSVDADAERLDAVFD